MTKQDRLSPDRWIAAGLTALAEDGPPALKAEPLARRLGTTKGSFYWHFADVPAFHAALLDAWAEQAAQMLLTSDDPDPRHRLRAFAKAATGEAALLDPAIRAWARSEPLAAETLARVDAAREAHLSALLAEIGMPNPDFVHMLHAALIGSADLAAREGRAASAALSTLVDLVLTYE